MTLEFSGQQLLLIVVSMLSLDTVGSVIKRWVPNTNYDNPDNWNVGRLPCQMDTISFAVQSPPVFIQHNITTATMELPMNGELILGEGVVIAARPADVIGQGSQGSNCQGQNVKFIRTEPMEWLDPNNWCQTKSVTGDCLDPQPAILDTERVPCMNYDDVVFPLRSTFLISLDLSYKLLVKSLTIGGSTHSTQSANQYFASENGKKQFRLEGNTGVEVTDNSCEDVTGCACGNDKGSLMHAICDTQGHNCTTPLCDSPLTPKGHCCPVCGTVLTMDYSFGFILSSFKNKITNNVLQGKNNVITIFSKSSNDRIQIVVLDADNSGVLSQTRGEKIADYIKADITDAQKLSVSDLRIQTSGTSHAPQTGAIKGQSFFHSPASIAGAVITAIILLLLLGGVLFCFVDRGECRTSFRQMPLTLASKFRRFGPSSEGKEILEMDDSVSYIDIMRRESGDINTFDNPMYNIPTPGGATVQDLTTKQKQAEVLENNNEETPAILDASSVTFVLKDGHNGKGSGRNTSFANPMFGTCAWNVENIDPCLRLNPVYSEEGIEEDSNI